MSEVLSLWGLLAGCFMAPAFTPGASEALLVAVADQKLYPVLLLLAVATVGNTLGGASHWIVGGVAARWWTHPGGARMRALLDRFGPMALLLAWIPVAGDVLCMFAGWLRLHFWSSLLFMTMGKLLRYGLVLALYKAFI